MFKSVLRLATSVNFLTNFTIKYEFCAQSKVEQWPGDAGFWTWNEWGKMTRRFLQNFRKLKNLKFFAKVFVYVLKLIKSTKLLGRS